MSKIFCTFVPKFEKGMKNVLKTVFVLAALVLSASGVSAAQKRVVAFDKRAVADSLTSFAQRKATVGKIKVTTVKVKNDNMVEVFASRQFSTIPFSNEDVAYLDSVVSQIVLGRPDGTVRIYCDDRRHEIGRLVSSFRRTKDLPSDDIQRVPYRLKKGQPLTQNASVPYTISSGLQGEHIALWGSHGIYFNQKEDRWLWQRAKLLTTVEDLYTTGYTMPFLVPMLENAGAVVIQPRERDTQLNEVIVDERNARTEGEWISVEGAGWGDFGKELLEGDNPFKMGAYVRTTEGVITYPATLPEAGEYAVYISYKTESNSTNKAKYTVCHRGVETTYLVNQQMGGSMWVYLGTFDFSTDTAQNYVRLTSEDAGGKLVTSDAVRFGGGWCCVARYAQPEAVDNVPSAVGGQGSKVKGQKVAAEAPTEEQLHASASVSGYPKWVEGARYFMQFSGVPDSVYNYTESKNDYIDDYASRGSWVNWLAGGSSANPKEAGQNIPVTLSLAFHTDAGNIKKDSIVGTLAIYTDFDNDKDTVFPNGASQSKSRDYCDYMQTQIVEDVRALYAPEWTRRMLHNSSYSEARVPKVPAVLLELLSHQNFADMCYGLDPRFRFTVSRAIYKGMLRFLHEQYGTPYLVQPLPVKNFSAEIEDGYALLHWTPVSDPLEDSAEPSFYVVYTRVDDGDWDNGQRVAPQSTEGGQRSKVKGQRDFSLREEFVSLPIETGKRYDFKVVAGNAGGISFPSEVLSVYKAPRERGNVLIVNGFNRVGAPEIVANTDSLAGFKTESFPVAYKKDVIYIGAEYDFVKANPWTSDDDQGYGACYADKAKETEAGNTFDYPVMHGKVLQKLGYSYCSCAASAVDSLMLAHYDVVDLIMGKQKETSLGVQKITTDFKTFTPELQSALRSYQGNLLCSGAYIGSDMRSKADTAFTRQVLHYEYRTHHATRSGEIDCKGARGLSGLRGLSGASGKLVMEQNPTILPTENPDAIRPSGKNAKICARYEDSGLGAGVQYEADGQKQLIYSFPLESLAEFEPFYENAIKWLVK